MSSDYINAHCAICGAGYHVCGSCLEQKAFKPWRTVTDSIRHFQIYSILHDVTVGAIEADEAREKLASCDLSGLDTFVPEVRRQITELMGETGGR